MYWISEVRMKLKEFGPYFRIPTQGLMDLWQSMGIRKRVYGRAMTVREEKLLGTLQYFTVQAASGEFQAELPPEERIISASELIQHLIEVDPNSNIDKLNTLKSLVRQVSPQLEALKVFKREIYQAQSNTGRPTYIYTMQDPSIAVKNAGKEIDLLEPDGIDIAAENKVSLSTKKKKFQELKMAYEARDDIYLAKIVNSEEPWSTQLFGTLLDQCCRETPHDKRGSITARSKVNGEIVSITSEAPEGGLMIKTDARYLMALLTLNMQSNLSGETNNQTKNRFAVDISELIRLFNYDEVSGGHRVAAWAAIDRIRQTKWKINFDPKGNLAKELSKTGKLEHLDTVYLDVLTNVVTGIDTGDDGSGESGRIKTPRFIEYSLGNIIFSGMLSGSKGLIVHPELLVQRNGHMLSIYHWLRRTLPPNGSRTLGVRDIYTELGVNTSYQAFSRSLIKAMLKHADIKDENDLIQGESFSFDFFGYEATCFVEATTRKKSNKNEYKFQWAAPADLLAKVLTDSRNTELQKNAQRLPMPQQGSLI